jgi:hypothetical protein
MPYPYTGQAPVAHQAIDGFPGDVQDDGRLRRRQEGGLAYVKRRLYKTILSKLSAVNIRLWRENQGC